jgi:hypothetical protein
MVQPSLIADRRMAEMQVVAGRCGRLSLVALQADYKFVQCTVEPEQE